VTTILVTGAGGSATSNVIDSVRLGSTVSRVIGADCSAINLHLSKADRNYVIPRSTEPEWSAAVSEIASSEGAEVVHCQPDHEVLALGRARTSIPASVFLPSQPALEVAADKVEFAASMARHGVAVPESRGFADAVEAKTVIEELLRSTPSVWVRARRGAGGRASLPVSRVAQALAWMDWWCTEKGAEVHDFMAAEQLPGREFAYQSIWQDGRLVAGQARERVEYLYGHLTPHGQTSTPSVARTVREPSVDQIAQAAIVALDPHPEGVFCVDIKEDRSGTPKVTEVNAGRFFTTSNFFAHAGLNMPDMLVRAALGESLPTLGTSPLEPDLYWIRMVDMGYVLVEGSDIDRWDRAGQ
jgi:carbamoyl-phosphate synthase large subunit